VAKPFCLLALVSVAFPLFSQTATVPYHPYGSVISAETRPADFGIISFRRATITAAEEAEAEQKAFAFGSLDAGDTKTGNSAGFSLGYGTKLGGRDVVVVGVYSRSMPQSGSDQDSAVAFGQIVFSKTRIATVSGAVALVYDPDSYKAVNPVLAAEHAFIPDTLKAVANLGWLSIDPDSADSVSDLQPAIGASWSPGVHLWTFGADYVFDNEIDGEDTGSVSVLRAIPRWGSELKISAKKHQVIALSFTKYF